MQLHPNAKATPRSRLEIVQRLREAPRTEEVPEAFGLSVPTLYKWLRRYREEGQTGLEDRRSAPRAVDLRVASRAERAGSPRHQRAEATSAAAPHGAATHTLLAR